MYYAMLNIILYAFTKWLELNRRFSLFLIRKTHTKCHTRWRNVWREMILSVSGFLRFVLLSLLIFFRFSLSPVFDNMWTGHTTSRSRLRCHDDDGPSLVCRGVVAMQRRPVS